MGVRSSTGGPGGVPLVWGTRSFNKSPRGNQNTHASHTETDNTPIKNHNEGRGWAHRPGSSEAFLQKTPCVLSQTNTWPPWEEEEAPPKSCGRVPTNKRNTKRGEVKQRRKRANPTSAALIGSDLVVDFQNKRNSLELQLLKEKKM